MEAHNDHVEDAINVYFKNDNKIYSKDDENVCDVPADVVGWEQLN